MALRFLADHCVSNSTVQSIREAHQEVLRLKDVLPVESSDTIVIAKARELDEVLAAVVSFSQGNHAWPATTGSGA